MRTVADLLRRSFAGPIGNVLALGVLFFGTDLRSELPVATAAFLFILTLRLTARAVLVVRFRYRLSEPTGLPLWLIGVSAYLLSAPTGLYAALVVRHYGFASSNTLLLCVFAMTCAASGVTTIAPNLPIAIGFQLSILAPIVAASLLAGGRDGRVAAAATTLFAIYTLLDTFRQNAEYRRNVAAEERLRRRADELHEARTAAESASRAKSEFLAKMSHEIRTPMNGVLGMMELVMRMELSAEQRRNLGYARDSAEVLLALLNDLLDHAKAEAGKLGLEAVDFELRDVVQRALHPFAAQVADKGLSLTASVAPDVPLWLNGDPGRLRQVLVNLLSNAVKFTVAGSVRVSVTGEPGTAQRARLRFVVEDTGPGIPTDKLASIFDAFSQADSSITRRFGGTGLGLAICSDIVKLMEGRIWAESAPGRGSAFHFTAGFALSSGPVSCERSRPEAPVRAPLRVLIAEDNRVNQKVLGQMLKVRGHSFEVAEDGENVIQRVCDGCFDVVLMDVQMPGIDGLEATRRIRAMNNGRSGVPIIGVTAGATPTELAACLEAGMNSYITKPITLRAVEKALAGV